MTRILISVFFLCLSAHANLPSLQTTHLALPHQKFKLKNGLEVILQHDPGVSSVCVHVTYRVGARNEKAGKTGFAHLFEHLMFNGSVHVGRKHYSLLEQAGVSLANGTTSYDLTDYFEVVPSSELDLALWLESDRMGWLLPMVTQTNLDEERKVVINERFQRIENPPYGLLQEKQHQTLIPPSHPYFGRVMGSIDDLNAASLADVHNFFAEFYAPSNATLAIVGNFDSNSIFEKVNKYFGDIPDRPQPSAPKIPPLKAPTQEIQLHEKELYGTQKKLRLMYLTPAFFQKYDAEMDILADILTGSRNARLWQRLIAPGLVSAVNASQISLQDTSIFTIDAMVKDEQDMQVVLAEIDDELQKVKASITPKEIQLALNNWLTNRVVDLQKISTRASLLQMYNYYLGNPDGLQEDVKRYSNVTPELISQAMERFLNPHQRVVLFATPVKVSNDLNKE